MISKVVSVLEKSPKENLRTSKHKFSFPATLDFPYTVGCLNLHFGCLHLYFGRIGGNGRPAGRGWRRGRRPDKSPHAVKPLAHHARNQIARSARVPHFDHDNIVYPPICLMWIHDLCEFIVKPWIV